jgi:hypothetical protein
MSTRTRLYSTGALLVAACAAAVIIGCSGNGQQPLSTVEATPGMLADEDRSHLETAGARLWAQNCIRCHNMRTPASLSDRQWQIAMHHMRVRAGLTAEQHEAILQFLQAAN